MTIVVSTITEWQARQQEVVGIVIVAETAIVLHTKEEYMMQGKSESEGKSGSMAIETRNRALMGSRTRRVSNSTRLAGVKS